MTEKRKENKMGIMPIRRLIISMSWPAILSMTIQALYNVVDSIFVAKIGEEALTAITLVFPVQMMMIALGVGTGVGVNSLISRRLGAKKFDEANLAASNGFKLSFINWIIFAVFGAVFSEPFMALFTENDYIIQQGKNYLMIITIGCLFMMVQMSCEKILQSTGNMILPMFSTLTGAIINIILDPILIFGLLGAPKLGMIGAAIATVIGQACGMILACLILFKKEHAIKINLKEKFNKKTLKEIYAVGGPTIVMQAIASIMNLGMNGILATFSDTAVAVMGVYGRLQSFIFMPVFGINQGSMPVFGYNYGAKHRKRVMKAFRVALIIALIIMGIGLVLFQTIPSVFLGWFNASEAMYELGVPAFRTISICFLPAAFGIISTGLFGATGHGLVSLVGSLIRQLIGILPLAWILAQVGGASAVWWAFPMAEVLGLIYSIIMIRYIYKKDILTLDIQIEN